MKISTKKEGFLQESLKLIHEKGFKAMTMRDIADRMDFDVSNSYNYIKSKQEILENFLFRTSHDFHEAMDNIMASNYTLDEKLKQVISSHIQIASQRPYEVALMVNEWRNLKEPKYTEYITLRDGYEQKMRDLLQAGMDATIFKAMDVDIATAVILSSLRWFHDKYTQNQNVLNPIELERQIIGFVFHGIIA